MLLVLLRLLFGVVSLIVLAGSGYLLWSWYDGEAVVLADGSIERLREDWRLWTGLGLLAWSLLGRMVVVPMLARPDKERPGRAGQSEKLNLGRGDGETLAAPANGSIYIERAGNPAGQPIILVHGWGLDSTIWDYARRDLSTIFRLIRFDLRGLGKSDAPINAVGLSQLANDLKELVSCAGGNPVLVGHSIGGMIIQTLARDHHDFLARNVDGVVLLNTTYTNPIRTSAMSGLLKALRWPLLEPSLWLSRWLGPLAWLGAWQSYLSGWAHVANRFGFGRDVSRSQLNATTLIQTRNSPSVQAKGNLAMMRWDATSALPAFPTPLLVIGGAADIITKPEASRHIARMVPNAQLEIVPGVGHMGFLERADIYSDAITKFARAVSRKLTASVNMSVASVEGQNDGDVGSPNPPETAARATRPSVEQKPEA